MEGQPLLRKLVERLQGEAREELLEARDEVLDPQHERNIERIYFQLTKWKAVWTVKASVFYEGNETPDFSLTLL